MNNTTLYNRCKKDINNAIVSFKKNDAIPIYTLVARYCIDERNDYYLYGKLLTEINHYIHDKEKIRGICKYICGFDNDVLIRTFKYNDCSIVLNIFVEELRNIINNYIVTDDIVRFKILHKSGIFNAQYQGGEVLSNVKNQLELASTYESDNVKYYIERLNYDDSWCTLL